MALWIELRITAANAGKIRRMAQDLGVSYPTALGHCAMLWMHTRLHAPDGIYECGAGVVGSLHPTELSQGQFEQPISPQKASEVGSLHPPKLADDFRDLADDLATAMQWKGDPCKLFEVLVVRRFLDRVGKTTWYVHNWEIYAGDLRSSETQTAERERKSLQRAKHRATEASQGQFDLDLSHGTKQTVPGTDRNGPGTKQTVPSDSNCPALTGQDRTGQDRTEKNLLGPHPTILDSLERHYPDLRHPREFAVELAGMFRLLGPERIAREVGLAHQWEVDKPKRAKTQKERFLRNWIKRSEDDAVAREERRPSFAGDEGGLDEADEANYERIAAQEAGQR